MATSLDEETRALLETLAGGFYRDDVCMCCGSHISYTQEALTANHAEICPTRRARTRLEENGTPVKLWIISYSQRRTDIQRISNASLRVIRYSLRRDDAIKLVTERIVYQGRRELVEGSIEIQEIPLVR